MKLIEDLIDPSSNCSTVTVALAITFLSISSSIGLLIRNGTATGPVDSPPQNRGAIPFLIGLGTRIRTLVDGIKTRNPSSRRSPKSAGLSRLSPFGMRSGLVACSTNLVSRLKWTPAGVGLCFLSNNALGFVSQLVAGLFRLSYPKCLWLRVPVSGGKATGKIFWPSVRFSFVIDCFHQVIKRDDADMDF